MVHCVSSNPHVVYTVKQGEVEVSAVDMSPALAYRPKTSVAACGEHVVISDLTVRGEMVQGGVAVTLVTLWVTQSDILTSFWGKREREIYYKCSHG